MTGHDARTPNDEQRAKIAAIIDRPGDDADDEHEERLDGANPGYRRGGRAEGHGSGVVSLKNAVGVDDAPGVEPEHKGGEDV